MASAQAPGFAPLISEVREVHSAMGRIDRECPRYLKGIPSDQEASARNLLHYMALRSHDLRHVQPLLAAHGLSSLGRTESHVRQGLEAVLKALHALEGVPWPKADPEPLTEDVGEALLWAHTDALFGPAPDGRTVRIMVTMPGEAGTDYLLVRDLVAAGMDCMRINCAHDDAAVWERMVEHLRRANHEVQRACRLSMDIGGPKLRTGALVSGPSVLKIKPRRDALGLVQMPALVALVAASKPRRRRPRPLRRRRSDARRRSSSGPDARRHDRVVRHPGTAEASPRSGAPARCGRCRTRTHRIRRVRNSASISHHSRDNREEGRERPGRR